MTKYERLLFLTNVLRTRKNLNAAALAKECEVTERTIYRDIVALSAANLPIYYDRGYKFLTGNFMPPLNFTLQEFLTLREALNASPLRRIPDRKSALRGIEAKIEAALSANVLEERRSSGGASMLLERARPEDPFHSRIFSEIEKAIRERRIVEMKYDSIDSGMNTRQVEPYFSVYVEGKFYFVGYCLWRQASRTFRMNRIVSLAATGATFRRRPDINPESYFAHSWSVFGGDIFEITIEFSGRSAKLVRGGAYMPNEVKKDLGKGRLRYQARVAGLEEVGRWLVGFGAEATVVSPPELRQWVRERAAGALSQNS